MVNVHLNVHEWEYVDRYEERYLYMEKKKQKKNRRSHTRQFAGIILAEEGDF